MTRGVVDASEPAQPRHLRPGCTPARIRPYTQEVTGSKPVPPTGLSPCKGTTLSDPPDAQVHGIQCPSRPGTRIRRSLPASGGSYVSSPTGSTRSSASSPTGRRRPPCSSCLVRHGGAPRPCVASPRDVAETPSTPFIGPQWGAEWQLVEPESSTSAPVLTKRHA